jgi:hypothetical protein
MRIGILALFIPLLCPAAEIPEGSHVALHMVNSITTKTAKEGDYVYMRTATPIAANGQIVVPVGSYVQGVVSKSVRSGRIKGTAELGIRIETMTLATGDQAGKVIRIAPRLASVDSDGSPQKVDGKESEIKQGTSHGEDAKTIATLGGTGAAIGGIADRSFTGAGIGAGVGGAVGLVTVLVTRGKEVELRQGSTVDVVFDRAIPVD